VSRGEAPVRFGSLLERIRCCNGRPQPCGGHGAIEGRKLFETGDGIVGDDVDTPPLFWLRLHSVGIGEASGRPDEVDALIHRLAATQNQSAVHASGRELSYGGANVLAPAVDRFVRSEASDQRHAVIA
jgi:hypothetical protein